MDQDNRISAPNLAELYRRAAERWGKLPAFATRRRALDWMPLTFEDLYERGLCLATGLIDIGVEAREHVGLFADNRMEWILADYGVQLCGAADVPRGRDVTDAELRYIINHAGVRVAFVETAELQDQVLRLRGEMPDLRKIILLDPAAQPSEETLRITDLVTRGRELRAAGDTRAEVRIEGIRPDDLFTLIYTSGTTGHPKGVMLTHSNMIHQIETIPIPVSCTDRVVSILPIWHIFERVFEMLTISCGACTYYSNVRTLGDDLKNVEPTFMGSAPRLWESLHQRILKNVRNSHPVRRALFHIAYFLAHYYQESIFFLRGRRLEMRPLPLWKKAMLSIGHAVRWFLLLPWYGFFNAAVLERVRQAAGGSLKATISGGGALPIDIDRFFNYIGIPVLEGYGLTESSPVLAVRTNDALVVGTVGPPMAGTEINILCVDTGKVLCPDPNRSDGGRGLRGEIRARGPQIMKGYYRDPEATSRALRNGWLHTGDLGTITFNGCVKILGRCKETIVLLSGENLEPGPIEMRLRQSPLVDQCMVVGQDRKFIGVLIVPNLDGFRERGLVVETAAQLAEDRKAYQLVRDEIRRTISTEAGFKQFELVRDFRIVPGMFTVGEELTNLFKLKRHVVEEKYADLIRDIFEPVEEKRRRRHGD